MRYLPPSVNQRGADTGDAVLKLQGRNFLNVNMFCMNQQYLLEYQAYSVTWQTSLSLTKGLCLTEHRGSDLVKGTVGWGRENSRAAQPEQACDITKPFPADPWPAGPLDRRGAQRRPILHYPPTADRKPLTLSQTKAGRQAKLDFWGCLILSPYRRVIFISL